ncbi:MAG: hypothetical protein CMH62_02165 [Nanoarchaeota archaeon]|nr:hypothetical protein [Nanoarchaeota archaeon]|tara:strand:- start:183 stop:908 length:726 start_codon:yes stop_codon:yes gene_type:complete
MELTKKELRNLLIASIIAGLVFSFNEWGIETFNLVFGLKNFIRAILISALIYSVHIFAQKIAARRISCDAEFSLISTTSKRVPKYFKNIGPIATILISILSNGKLFFIALASFTIKTSKKKRVGHKWTNIKETEEAAVAAAGPLSNLTLLILFKLLLPLATPFFSKAMFIASTLAIFHLIPFPQFDGIKLLVGSRISYVFVAVLTILTVILVNFLGAISSVIIALIIALALTLFYLYKLEK